MALINYTVSGFFNGVSQQPPSLRYDTQAELVLNHLPSVSKGLERRPPLKRVSALQVSLTWYPFTHVVEMAEDEKYVINIGTSGITDQPTGQVVDMLTGAQASGSPFANTWTNAKIPQTQTGEDPAEYLCAATAGDYTIVVDKRAIVAMKAATTDPNEPAAFVVVKASVTETSYSVVVQGTTCTYTTGSSPLSGGTVALTAQITASINSLVGFHGCTAVQNGNLIKITRNAGGDFTFKVYDGWGNAGLTGIKGSVSRYSDLPPVFYEGYRIKVGDSVGEGKGAYYVEWKSSAGANTGTWVETTPYGITNEFDPLTMPKVFYRDGSNNFILRDYDWTKRLVGDNTSCPLPSFVGQRITDVFYWRGRLGFVSGENVFLSRADDPFNLWPKSATIVSDSDPIDVAASTNEVQKFLYAVPFQKALLLFTNKAQFTLTSGDLLSPRNAKIDFATAYHVSPSCRPVNAGGSVFFPSQQGNNTSLREYFIQPDGLTYGSEEVSAHASTYLPNDINKLIVSPTESIVIALSASEPHNAYVYQYQWSGEEKIQSALHKWTFTLRTTIVGAYFVGSSLYVFNKWLSNSSVDKLDTRGLPNDGSLPYAIYMDHKAQQTGTLITSGGVQYTAYALSSSNVWGAQTDLDDEDVIELRSNLCAVLGSEWGTAAGQNLPLTFINYGGIPSQPVVKGDWTAHPVWLGVSYKSQYRLSEQFAKDSQGKSAEAGRLQLRRMEVRHSNTGYYRAEVNVNGRDAESYVMTSKTIGNSALVLGTPRLVQGSFAFPVLSKSTEVTVDLINDTTLPSTLHSLTWSGNYTVRSQSR